MKKIISYCCVVGILIFSLEAFSLSLVPLNDYYFSKRCPQNKPFTSREEGGCFGCDALFTMTFLQENKKDFERCSNRENVEEGRLGRSRLKKCPIPFPLRDNTDSCISCDTLESVITKTKNDCDVCPNRFVRTEKYDDEVEYFCQLKKCPDEAPLGQGNYSSSEVPFYFAGDCLPCNTTEWTKDSKDICSKCPNREYKDGWCVLKERK